MKALLSNSFSTLSSIKSTPVDHASALTQLGILLARLTEEQYRDELDAFVRLQERFEWNGQSAKGSQGSMGLMLPLCSRVKVVGMDWNDCYPDR